MYSCNECSSLFTRTDNLKRHKISKHTLTENIALNEDSLETGMPNSLKNAYTEKTDSSFNNLNQLLKFDANVMKFQHPFTMMITGPTGSGKTVFVENLLSSSLITLKDYSEVIYCYGAWQQRFERINAKFIEGLPNIENFDGSQKLVIIDDLMHEADDSVTKLFTKYSHHRNVSIVFITQNLFCKTKGITDINRNTHYLVIFKNPRDCSQVQFLSRQVFPHDAKKLEKAYLEATSQPHGYLLVDFRQSTPDFVRMRSNIFSETPTVHGINLLNKNWIYDNNDQLNSIENIGVSTMLNKIKHRGNNKAVSYSSAGVPLSYYQFLPEYVKENLPFLRELNNCDLKQAMKVCKKYATNDEIESLCKCAKDILKGKMLMDNINRKRSRVNRKQFKSLASKSISIDDKRHYLQSEKGGSVLAAITGILGRSVRKGYYSVRM
jgi:hypothetical protein